MPEVVIAEVVAKHREELIEADKKLRGVASSFRHLGRQDLAEMVIGIDVAGEAARFASQLDTELVTRGVRLLQWPPISHEEVVRRILAGRRPARNEAGYRDALIWESVIEHLKTSRPAKAVFVTYNSKDFYEGERLHPHLVEDLVGAGIDPSSLTVELSLAGLNKRVFEPTLALLDHAKEQLQHGTYPGLNLASWLEENAVAMMDDDDVRDAATDLPRGCGSVSFSLDEIEAFEVVDVRKLSTGELLVQMNGTLRGTVSASLSGWDYERFSQAREWMGSDPHYEGNSVDVSMHSTVIPTFELVLGNGGVLSAELAGISGDCGESLHVP